MNYSKSFNDQLREKMLEKRKVYLTSIGVSENEVRKWISHKKKGEWFAFDGFRIRMPKCYSQVNEFKKLYFRDKI